MHTNTKVIAEIAAMMITPPTVPITAGSTMADWSAGRTVNAERKRLKDSCIRHASV